jgi:hypothetical protein
MQKAVTIPPKKSSVRTSQETHYVSATKPNRLMLFREIIAVYCENRMKYTNALCGQNVLNQAIRMEPLGFKGLMLALCVHTVISSGFCPSEF